MAAELALSGTYRVVRTIGRGGMGEMYEVRHLRTKAPLALKVLMADSRMPQQVFQRFKREAEITSNLNHPNIVRVFDFDNLPDGRPFLVMELLEGRELTQLLEPGKPLPPADVVAIVQQIGQGLSAAHERGGSGVGWVDAHLLAACVGAARVCGPWIAHCDSRRSGFGRPRRRNQP